MVIQLDSRAEQLIEEQLNTGRFHSPEEVVARALEAMASAASADPSTPDRAQAVQNMMAFAGKHKLTLGDDLSIQDLIREGRKY